jgi:hypothetical protein
MAVFKSTFNLNRYAVTAVHVSTASVKVLPLHHILHARGDQEVLQSTLYFYIMKLFILIPFGLLECSFIPMLPRMLQGKHVFNVSSALNPVYGLFVSIHT